MTVVADEMKMPWMPVRRLEAGPAFTEIDLPRDARIDQPLERPVYGRPTDTRVFATDEIAEIVRAQVPLLAQKDTENAVALTRSLAAGRAEAGEIQGIIRQ